jgi:hypothetical protein
MEGTRLEGLGLIRPLAPGGTGGRSPLKIRNPSANPKSPANRRFFGLAVAPIRFRRRPSGAPLDAFGGARLDALGGPFDAPGGLRLTSLRVVAGRCLGGAPLDARGGGAGRWPRGLRLTSSRGRRCRCLGGRRLMPSGGSSEVLVSGPIRVCARAAANGAQKCGQVRRQAGDEERRRTKRPRAVRVAGVGRGVQEGGAGGKRRRGGSGKNLGERRREAGGRVCAYSRRPARPSAASISEA